MTSAYPASWVYEGTRHTGWSLTVGSSVMGPRYA